MSRALIILNSTEDYKRAHRWIDLAPVGTSVEFKRGRRSGDQNALMWSRLTQIATQVEWYGAKLSAEDWKDVFSASLRKARVVPGIDDGTYVPLGMRTSDMTKGEMNDLLTLMEVFAATRGVTFNDQLEAAE